MIRRIIPALAILMLPSMLPGADRKEHDSKIILSGPSAYEGSKMYILQDGKGRKFEVNYAYYPDAKLRDRSIALKDLYYEWKRIGTKRLEFYFADDGVYSNLQLRKISYRNKDLRPYLPAGLAFHDRPDGLQCQFRVLVDDQSYMLAGKYTNEEDLLRSIYCFIDNIREGKVGLPDQGKYQMEVQNELYKERMKISPRFSLSIYGNYLQTRAKIAEAFDGGYGSMAALTLHNVGISLNKKTLFYMDFSLSSGYWKLTRKENPEPEVNCDVQKAYIVPVYLTAVYPIGIYGNLYTAPSFGVGYNYHSMDYDKKTVSGIEHVKVRRWAPSISLGAMLGYRAFDDRLLFSAGAYYTAMFEREMNVIAIVYYAGAGYIF